MNIEDIRDNFMTAPQAAKYLDITRNRVGRLCLEGRFEGAGKIDDFWLIPRKAVENHKRLRPGDLLRSMIQNSAMKVEGDESDD